MRALKSTALLLFVGLTLSWSQTAVAATAAGQGYCKCDYYDWDSGDRYSIRLNVPFFPESCTTVERTLEKHDDAAGDMFLIRCYLQFD